jgi:hypothetical protein
VTDIDKVREPTPRKTGDSDRTPEADQDEREPERPTPPDASPQLAPDDSAPVNPSPAPKT